MSDMDMGLAVLAGRPVIRVIEHPHEHVMPPWEIKRRIAAREHPFVRGSSHTVTGDAAWVSSETVMAAVTQFSSDLRQMAQEMVEQNPNFKDMGYMNAPPAQKDAHEAFLKALDSLQYDWWGVGKDWYGSETGWDEKAQRERDSGRKVAWKSTTLFSNTSVLEEALTKEELGYEEWLRIKKASTLSTLGATELSVVEGFRNRLKALIEQYKSLGYHLSSKLSPDPPKPPGTPMDAVISALKWVGGGAAVLGVSYLVYRFVPSGLFSIPGRPAAPAAPAAAPAVPPPGSLLSHP